MAQKLQDIQHELKLARDKGAQLVAQLEVEREALQGHESDIRNNENFTYTVEKPTSLTRPLPRGRYAINCLTCKMTCHENGDGVRSEAHAIQYGKNCGVCPGKCLWPKHKTQLFVQVAQTNTGTNEELKRRYEEASRKKAESVKLIDSLTKQFEEVKIKISALTEEERSEKCKKKVFVSLI